MATLTETNKAILIDKAQRRVSSAISFIADIDRQLEFRMRFTESMATGLLDAYTELHGFKLMLAENGLQLSEIDNIINRSTDLLGVMFSQPQFLGFNAEVTLRDWIAVHVTKFDELASDATAKIQSLGIPLTNASQIQFKLEQMGSPDAIRLKDEIDAAIAEIAPLIHNIVFSLGDINKARNLLDEKLKEVQAELDRQGIGFVFALWPFVEILLAILAVSVVATIVTVFAFAGKAVVNHLTGYDEHVTEAKQRADNVNTLANDMLARNEQARDAAQAAGDSQNAAVYQKNVDDAKALLAQIKLLQDALNKAKGGNISNLLRTGLFVVGGLVLAYIALNAWSKRGGAK